MQPAGIVEEESTPLFKVIWDGTELRFENPQPIRLAPGDILTLVFEGDLGNRIPGVSFVREPGVPAGPLGPFSEVMQTEDCVLLEGSSGVVGTFRCKAWLSPDLRAGKPAAVTSNELLITNEVARKPAKEIRVDVWMEGSETRVTVDLEELTIHTPDSVVWNFVFTGLEPEAFEPLLYVKPDSQPPAPSPFGPFKSLSVASVDEPLADRVKLGYRLIASGNNGIQGLYRFCVGVLPLMYGVPQASWSVVDPIIDNSGPPHR